MNLNFFVGKLNNILDSLAAISSKLQSIIDAREQLNLDKDDVSTKLQVLSFQLFKDILLMRAKVERVSIYEDEGHELSANALTSQDVYLAIEGIIKCATELVDRYDRFEQENNLNIEQRDVYYKMSSVMEQLKQFASFAVQYAGALPE